MKLRDLSAVMGLIAATDVGLDFDDRPRRRRRGRSDAIRNYAAIWIREVMDGCVCRPERRHALRARKVGG